MQQNGHMKLKLILISLLIGTVLHSTAMGQASSVPDFRAIARAANGERATPVDVRKFERQDEPCLTLAECLEKLRIAEQRLLKTLDALAKSEAVTGFKDAEINARKVLDNLKDQVLAVKDLIIEYQDQLIRRLQRPNSGFMGRLKQILDVAQKVILVAAGIYIGGRL